MRTGAMHELGSKEEGQSPLPVFLDFRLRHHQFRSGIRARSPLIIQKPTTPTKTPTPGGIKQLLRARKNSHLLFHVEYFLFILLYRCNHDPNLNLNLRYPHTRFFLMFFFYAMPLITVRNEPQWRGRGGKWPWRRTGPSRAGRS